MTTVVALAAPPDTGSIKSGDANKTPQPFQRLFTKPLIRYCDMPDAMRDSVLSTSLSACQKHSNNQEASRIIKEALDDSYGGSWHVVVGERFGLEITHELKSLLYVFYGGNLALCVWRCT